MGKLRFARRAFAIGGISAVIAMGIGATPAAAFSGGPPTACGPNWSMLCTGVAQAVQNGSDSKTETMEYTCSAVDVNAPLGINEQTGVGCVFIGANGLTYTAFADGGGTSAWTPGPTSSYHGSLTMVVQSYTLCIGAGRIFQGVSTGIVNHTCTQLNF
jgi:hypothetical protein